MVNKSNGCYEGVYGYSVAYGAFDGLYKFAIDNPHKRECAFSQLYHALALHLLQLHFKFCTPVREHPVQIECGIDAAHVTVYLLNLLLFAVDVIGTAHAVILPPLSARR